MYKNNQIQEAEERFWKAFIKFHNNDQIDKYQMLVTQMEEEDDDRDAIEDTIIMHESGLLNSPYSQEVWEELKEQVHFYEYRPEYNPPNSNTENHSTTGKRKIH